MLLFGQMRQVVYSAPARPYAMAMSIEAASPHISATVTASAGSGKTWLLVARMVRLLLHGAEPGSILALTFTRKAAGEMQVRLTERLRELALADDQTLSRLLTELGESPSARLIEKARGLYEQCLFTDYPVRTMTFHSFCQDILARFPLEANLPPDFELVENTALLIEQSLQQLYNQATLEPDGELASQLETLLDHCQSIDSTKTALKSFIDKRSDWWAYTENQSNPVEFAIDELGNMLSIDEEAINSLFRRSLPEKLKSYRDTLIQIATKTQLPHIETLASALDNIDNTESAFHLLLPVFMTQKMTPRACKVSAANRKKIGDDQAEDFIEHHQQIAEQLLDIHDHFLRKKTLQRNIAWYHAGDHFLSVFQQLKLQLHQLDFTDLEWRTYQLLKHSDNAEWVQYKLDQRIDHFLIDEFQDTNPTQWYLLKPLLEELAAGDPERQRTVFIVGDEKQSIYGFRRANPELQSHVASWLQQQIAAEKFPLNKSWRSSPAIIELVNKVFITEDDKLLLDFPQHGTHKSELPGQIELQQIFKAPDKEDLPEPIYFRNPLEQPRVTIKNQQYRDEGEWIASKIDMLIEQGLLIQRDNEQTPIQYDDIYILLKNRTHVAQIEQILRQHKIPFISANRSTLLHSLEIQDLEALLEVLVAPHNDLALARVLKSPIFDATDQHLLELSAIKNVRRWFKKVECLSDSLEPDHPVARAHFFLAKWRKITDRIPVHDLIDIIFFDTNLLNRYQAAAPEAIKNQVRANLQSFLELALDIDSGRYPSVTHFLNQLRNLKRLSGDAPDEAPADSGKARVNIMTVHAAKGLEAPVVFLADSAISSTPKLAHNAMVSWPTNQPRPASFHLMGVKESWDSVSKNYVDQSADFQQREDLNLLYVAITRAKQFLFISASEPGRSNKNNQSWYQLIEDGFKRIDNIVNKETGSSFNIGDIQYLPEAGRQQESAAELEIPENLSDVIFKQTEADTITPSQSEAEKKQPAFGHADEDAKTRGTVIHRFLELLTSHTSLDNPQLLLQVKIETGDILSSNEYQNCLNEAFSVISDKRYNFIFDDQNYDRAFNELPIHYQTGKKSIHGIIDRIVIKNNKVFLIDYKTHQNIGRTDIPEIAENYRLQIQFYKEGLERVWPDYSIKPYLFFTSCRELFEFK